MRKVFLALIVFCLSSAALGKTPSSDEKIFRMRLIADPQTFDWNVATTPMETYLLMNIMEGLVEFDGSMKLKPALAKTWTISGDQLTYTFKLRPGVKWSDGKPLTAQHFVDSWERLLNPLTAAPYAYMLFDIEGAEEYNSRKIKDISKIGIKAIDANTLEIRLKRPVGYFLQLLTFWVTFPIRKDLIDQHGTSWTKPGKMAVIGPFVPTQYLQGNLIVLSRNDLYYGKRPKMDSVHLKIVNEDSTALNLFKANQLDCVLPINFLELGDLAKSPAYKNVPYYRTSFIGFNTAKYPTNLPNVRKAIAMAIDKRNIAKVMHQSKIPAYSLVPPSMFPEGQNSGLEFDPKAAKKLLKETGIEASALPTLELLTYSSDENALLGQYVQDQLQKNLGLKISIAMPEYKTFRTQLDLQTATMHYRPWGADYSDPDTFFGVFTSWSGNNRTGWKNERYDEIVKKASAMQNGAARTKLYKEGLDLLLRQEAAIVPLHYDTLAFLLNPKVKGFVLNPLNYVYFRDINY